MQVAFGYHLPVVVVDLVVASPAQRNQIVDVGGTALRPGPDVMGLAHGGVFAAAPAAAVSGDQRVAHVRSQRMQALHHQALESGVVPVVPAGALAQVWRGGPQPMLSRLLAGCRVEALDEPRARSAGAALRSGRDFRCGRRLGSRWAPQSAETQSSPAMRTTYSISPVPLVCTSRPCQSDTCPFGPRSQLSRPDRTQGSAIESRGNVGLQPPQRQELRCWLGLADSTAPQQTPRESTGPSRGRT